MSLVGVLTARLTAYRTRLVPAITALLLLLIPDTTVFTNRGWLLGHLSITSEPIFTVRRTGSRAGTASGCRRRRSTARDACAVALAYRAFAAYAHRRLARPIGIAAIGLVVALIAVGWDVTAFWFDYPIRRPRMTTIQKTLARLPRDAIVVTNVPVEAYLTAGRGTHVLPSRTECLTLRRNRHYVADIAEWGRILSRRESYAYFGPSLLPNANAEELGRVVRLELLDRNISEQLYKIARRD